MTNFYFSIYQEHPKGWNLTKNHRCGRHKKGCSRTWKFLSTPIWYIVQIGVSNSLDTSRGATSATIKPHPYQKACGVIFSLGFCQFWFCIRNFGLPKEGFQLSVKMRQDLWELCMSERLQTFFFIHDLSCRSSSQRLSSIMNFLFNRLSRTTNNVISKI